MVLSVLLILTSNKDYGILAFVPQIPHKPDAFDSSFDSFSLQPIKRRKLVIESDESNHDQVVSQSQSSRQAREIDLLEISPDEDQAVSQEASDNIRTPEFILSTGTLKDIQNRLDRFNEFHRISFSDLSVHLFGTRVAVRNLRRCLKSGSIKIMEVTVDRLRILYRFLYDTNAMEAACSILPTRKQVPQQRFERPKDNVECKILQQSTWAVCRDPFDVKNPPPYQFEAPVAESESESESCINNLTKAPQLSSGLETRLSAISGKNEHSPKTAKQVWASKHVPNY
jgi:hypothetical protein